jgi:hypothetical protein
MVVTTTVAQNFSLFDIAGGSLSYRKNQQMADKSARTLRI